MNHLCVIPARMGSSRYPGKPLANILGKPMVGHIFARATQEKIFDKVVVATCDQEIADYCLSKDIPYVMTSDKHNRASERVVEATEFLEKQHRIRFKSVTLLQGDEPMVTPSMLRSALGGLVQSDYPVVNLVSRIRDVNEFHSFNCVKTVMRRDGRALYFSRAPVPASHRPSDTVPTSFKQVCIIPFRRDFLDAYSNMPETYLEIMESIDMNRILECGQEVLCVEVNEDTYPVDVDADRVKVEKLMRNDPLVQKYIGRI